jgi:hypothetical protein
MASSSGRVVATICRLWTHVSANVLESADSWGRGVLDRVAVLAAAPGSTLLTLLLQLLLGLGIGKAKEELDAILLRCDTVVLFDDTFCDIAAFKAFIQSAGAFDIEIGRLTEQIQLPC